MLHFQLPTNLKFQKITNETMIALKRHILSTWLKKKIKFLCIIRRSQQFQAIFSTLLSVIVQIKSRIWFVLFHWFFFYDSFITQIDWFIIASIRPMWRVCDHESISYQHVHKCQRITTIHIIYKLMWICRGYRSKKKMKGKPFDLIQSMCSSWRTNPRIFLFISTQKNWCFQSLFHKNESILVWIEVADEMGAKLRKRCNSP